MNNAEFKLARKSKKWIKWITCAGCGQRRAASTLAEGYKSFVCRYCLSTNPVLPARVAAESPPLPPEGCLLFACDTGDGWCLTVATTDGDVFGYLAWPEWWPKDLTATELRERGFDIQPS